MKKEGGKLDPFRIYASLFSFILRVEEKIVHPKNLLNNAIWEWKHSERWEYEKLYIINFLLDASAKRFFGY